MHYPKADHSRNRNKWALSLFINLVVISPHWEGVRTEIAFAFGQWHRQNYQSEIEIEWLDQGGTSDDVRFVESLYAKNPAGIDIDLFFGGGVDPYLRLKSKGLLQPYKVSRHLLKTIPATCLGIPNYDKEFYWYGVVLSSFGILYNKKVLNYLKLPYPGRWEDLAQPCYFSWVAAADPRHSGSMHMMYEIILQAYGWKKGWEIILGLAGNTQNFSASASQVARETGLANVAVSLCIDSYALAQIEVNGEESMGFVLPEEKTVINPDAVGILKGAPHLESAQRFIDFLLSEQGQLLWMLKKGAENGPRQFSLNRLSIRPDIYRHPAVLSSHLNPYNFAGAVSFNSSLAAERWALINDLVGACAVDCHRELKEAWQIVAKTRRPELKEKFFELPLDVRLQKFFMDNWSNPAFRNRYLAQWLNFSREKFKMLVKQAQYQK